MTHHLTSSFTARWSPEKLSGPNTPNAESHAMLQRGASNQQQNNQWVPWMSNTGKTCATCNQFSVWLLHFELGRLRHRHSMQITLAVVAFIALISLLLRCSTIVPVAGVNVVSTWPAVLYICHGTGIGQTSALALSCVNASTLALYHQDH